MNYIEFEDIIGHEKQKKIITTFLMKERIPHAFLFSGQDGIGKKKTAIAVARYILCEKNSGCGVCRACTRVNRITHPDLIVLDKNYMEWAGQAQRKKGQGYEGERQREINTISIDFIRGNEEKKIRGINQEVNKFPSEGRKRIIIIDNAEDMTEEAANAFLKTLEEPPEFNLFFLITSRESELPATIRSRCTRISFSPLSQSQLRQYFIDTLNLKEEKAELLSYISNGSINNGFFWLDDEKLHIRKRLGEFVLMRTKGYVEATVLSEYISRGNREISIYIFFLFSLFRDLYLIKNINRHDVIINRDFIGLLERSSYSNDMIERAIKKIQETACIIRYNMNKWLLLENLILQVMR